MTDLSSTIIRSVKQPVAAQESVVNSRLHRDANVVVNNSAENTIDVSIGASIDLSASSSVHNATAAAEINHETGTERQEQTEFSTSDEVLEEAVTHLKEYLQNINRNLEFSIDKDSGRTLVKVIDADTDEVIRQIPSEDIVRMSRNLEDASGLLVDARA